MSRHRVVDLPSLEVVSGYDHHLRSFFGQVFLPASRDPGIVRAGWPASSGLGLRRPILTHAEAEQDLALLVRWVLQQDWPHARSLVWAAHVARVRDVLLREWEEGGDLPSPVMPTILREAA